MIRDRPECRFRAKAKSEISGVLKHCDSLSSDVCPERKAESYSTPPSQGRSKDHQSFNPHSSRMYLVLTSMFSIIHMNTLFSLLDFVVRKKLKRPALKLFEVTPASIVRFEFA